MTGRSYDLVLNFLATTHCLSAPLVEIPSDVLRQTRVRKGHHPILSLTLEPPQFVLQGGRFVGSLIMASLLLSIDLLAEMDEPGGNKLRSHVP